MKPIAPGETNRVVANQPQLSPHTVKTHVHNAFAKLGADRHFTHGPA